MAFVDRSCQVEFMDQKNIEGKVEGSGNFKACKATFDC